MKPTEPLELLREWVAAINAEDAERVLSLYHEDAVLLPTFSAEVYLGAENIQRYFAHVYTNDRVWVGLLEKTISVQDIGDGRFVLGGLYNWEIEKEGDVRKPEARFTFCVDMNNPCSILHHHSSVLPG
ncbi:MAG: DUF4440 domain-containing protein [Verrucomicrobia bacterium]|nr:MAG: DUF4440 domain-containing protein [Verrucomicrobiota bacterium]